MAAADIELVSQKYNREKIRYSSFLLLPPPQSSQSYPAPPPLFPPRPPYLVKVENDVELADVAKVTVQDFHKQVDHLVNE